MPSNSNASPAQSNTKPTLSRLSLRILVYIILVSSVFAIASTIVQLRFDYQQDLSVIKETAKQIESSVTQPMAASLWNLDEQQLEIQVEGLLSLSAVESVQVKEYIDGKGVPLLIRGNSNAAQQSRQSFELNHQGTQVGELVIGSSLQTIIERTKHKAWLSLLTQVVQTMFLSIAILLIIYWSLIRHLNRIVEYTRELDLDKQAPQLKLKRPYLMVKHDELDELVETLAQMHERIHSELKANHRTNAVLQGERDFIQTVINSSNAVIVSLDTQYRIKDVNPSGVLLTGFTQDEMRGQNWVSLFVNHDQRSIIDPLLRDDASIQDVELNLDDDHGELQTLLWSFANVYENEKVKSIVAFGHEITNIKASQQQVVELNEQLEAKVDLRTERLEERNRQLATTLEQLKSTQESLIAAEKQASFNQLFQIFSRELNFPIAAALGNAQELHQGCEQLLADNAVNQELRQQLGSHLSQHQQLETQLERLAHVTSNFKQLVVGNQNRIAYSFNLKDNIQQLLLGMRKRLENESVVVELELDDKIEMRSYPPAISQIFSNLISNSLQHGFVDGSEPRNIRIEISTYRKHVRIHYSDNGKGMDEALAQSLFTTDESSKLRIDHGLGCHIIASLVRQLLGGEISVQTNELPGSHFKIVIPIDSTEKI